MKFFLIIIFFTPLALEAQTLAPDIAYVMQDTERIIIKRARSERDAMEYIGRAGKLQEYMSRLIANSEGKFCELSQDPVQCCNTFSQSPDQCLFEAIEKGTLNLSVLKEGVCDVAENMEGCASQVSSAVLLELMLKRTGTIHQFSSSAGSSPKTADVFVGRDASVPPVVDYESLQMHQLGKTAGVMHSIMDHSVVENYPEIRRVMEELNEYSIEALRKFYEGTEAPPAFPEGR